MVQFNCFHCIAWRIYTTFDEIIRLLFQKSSQGWGLGEFQFIVHHFPSCSINLFFRVHFFHLVFDSVFNCVYIRSSQSSEKSLSISSEGFGIILDLFQLIVSSTNFMIFPSAIFDFFQRVRVYNQFRQLRNLVNLYTISPRFSLHAGACTSQTI